MSQLPPIPLRLTIGVTGHRRIENEAGIREAVRTLVCTIRSRVKGTVTTPLELCILSPLAEGADRIVAEEILACEPKAELNVMLPLTEEEYMEDFETEASKKQFTHLVRISRNPASLRNRPLNEEYPPNMLSDARRQAYEDVGHFVVDHCDLLVAVYDGKPAKGKGGTSDIVVYAKKTQCPLYVIDALDPKTKPFDTDLNLNPLFAKIDTWNRLSERQFQKSRKPDPLGDYDENVFASLFPDGLDPENLLDGPKTTALQEVLIPHYTTASGLAKHHQSRYKLMGNLIFWLAFMAVAGVAVAVIFFRKYEGFFLSAFGLELFLMLTIIGIVFYDKKIGHFHKNWIECRFLAERIRTAFYYCICGLENRPVFVPRRITGDPPENRWMTFVFNEIRSRMPQSANDGTVNVPVLSGFIRKAWIDDQIKYHQDKSEACNRTYRTMELSCEIIFYLACASALGHILTHPLHSHALDHILTLSALVLPALAATLEGIRSSREYKRLAIRSQRMERQIMGLQSEFRLMTPEKLESILGKMEHLMVEETEDWLTFMSPAELYKVA